MIFESFQETLKEISWKGFYLYKKMRLSSFIKESIYNFAEKNKILIFYSKEYKKGMEEKII